MQASIQVNRRKTSRLSAVRKRFVGHHIVVLAFKMLWILCLFLLIPEQGRAEGSWQMGLFEGTSHRQWLRETITSSGISVLYVDVLTPGEVINVHACGDSNSDDVRVRLYNPSGSKVYDSTLTSSNVSCNSSFDTTFNPALTNPHQYVTTSSGAYKVYLTNNNGSYLYRYDVTVTNSIADTIDPRINGGRLWSEYWYLNSGSFAENYATDADLYVVADGGFVGTYFIWRLDLNNFAGYVYSLRANDLGVNSPNAAGDVVAGMSVRTSNNSIQKKYPIYLGYPAKSLPVPIDGVDVSDLSFVDSDGVDSGISPGSTNTIQDSGTFSFSTNLTTTGVYEIIIDNSNPTGGGPDGIYGQGDIFLRGTAVSGTNNVVWNGEDNNGVIIPQGAYTATLSVRTGEFHFAAHDVETSGGSSSVGIRMYRAQPNGADLPTTVFWDDSTVLNSTAANAFNQNGIFDGDHNWGAFNSGGVGNNAYIDTYTYGVIAEPNAIGVAVVENDIPMPTVSKSFIPSTVNTGGTSTMRLEIEYNGVLDLTGISLDDTMPLGMTLASNPASISVTGTGCTGFSFSASTVTGGDILNIDDGNIKAGSTCLITADVIASLPGDLVNTTSGVSSNELATGVVSNGASLTVQPNAAGAGFQCDGSFYESDTTGLSSRLYNINRDTHPYTRQEFSSASYSATSGFSYTGLAYNPTDNYLYGIVNQTNGASGSPLVGSIIRIDASGQVYNLGVPERGPNTMSMPVISDRFVGGTFAENGRYIVVTDLSATSHTSAAIPVVERGLILDIDINSNPPQVLYNRRHGRDVGDVVAHPDGQFYSHNTVEGLITLDNTTGTVSVIGGTLSDQVSGLMADAWGTLYAQTTTGNLVSIDHASGAGTILSPLAASATADGASCPFGVAMQKTVSATQLTPAGSAVYTLSVTNESNDVATFTLNDLLADAQGNVRTFEPGSLVNPLGGSVNAYGDTSTLTITGASISANSTLDVQVQVNFPHHYLPGISLNQAAMTGAGIGTVLSDFPDTAVFADSTPIDILPVTLIGISKQATVNGNDVTYEFGIENLGNTPISNVSLSDDLDAVFGAGNYVLTVPPLFGTNPGTLTLQSGYNGSGSHAVLLNVLDGGSLAVGAEAQIRFAVRLTTITDMGAGPGIFSNQVQVFGEGPGANAISDLSVDGNNPDPDDNGTPDEQSATVAVVVQMILVEGIVFEDNGVNIGTPHDGIHDADEALLNAVTVEARDGTTVIASTITSADGAYTLSLPASYGNVAIEIATAETSGYLSVSEYFRESPGNTGVVADGTVPFTPQLVFVGPYKIDFGRVRQPLWSSDSDADQEAGATVYHRHRYHPHSSGQLSFAVTGESSQPLNAAWQTVLFRDTNCNGSLDAGESALAASIAVSEDTIPLLCVVSKVFVPADASGGDSHQFSITATLVLDDPTTTGHAVVSVLQVTDITRVIASGEGLLVVAKTVQNVSVAGAVVTANTALPGHTLRYVIRFDNTGSGTLTELLISDSTPAFSSLSQPISCPSVLPAGLSSCQVLVPTGANNSVGYSGDVQWQFLGSLLAGAGGSVGYDILVD